MTPYREGGKGTYLLDRGFRGVGRIKRASGTLDVRLHGLLDAMLTTLYQAGRVDILKAIKDGSLTPLEVWSRFRVSELDRLPTVESLRPFTRKAVDAWVTAYDCSEHHRAGLRYSLRALAALGTARTTVQDVPDLLGKYKAKAAGRMFNRTRAALLAFLSDQRGIGRRHPLWAAVADIKVRKVISRKGSPRTPAQMTELGQALGTEGRMAWSMALTGMGPGEYWGRWEVEGPGVNIHGTKRKGRERVVPYVALVVKPHVSYVQFRKLLKETASSITPYDLRRTFATWMEQAGIPRTRRRLYLGHGATDVTDLYERHEVTAFLVEDGAKLRTFLGGGPEPGLKLEKAG